MLHSLQILRGLAAWCVIFAHIVQSYFMGEMPNIFWQFMRHFGGLGIDLFFILSGVVMAIVSENYRSRGGVFLINRAFRIFPVYWFYTALLILSVFILPTDSYLVQWSTASLLQSLLLIPNENPNGYGLFPTLYVGWTLSYEIFFYCVFSIVLLLQFKHQDIVCAGILLLIAFAFHSVHFLGSHSMLLSEFAAGIGLYLALQKYPPQQKKQWFLYGTIAVVCCVGVFLVSGLKMTAKLMFCSGVVATFIYLEPLLSKPYRLLQFLKTLGDYSYSTYLCHIIVIGWFYALSQYLKWPYFDLFAIPCILIVVYFMSKWSFRSIEINRYLASTKKALIDRYTTKVE